MAPIPRHVRRAAHLLCGTLLIACAIGLSPAVPHVSAHARLDAAAAPASVAYHLTALFTTGSMAGNVMDAAVAGSLDGSGVLTATLTATSGATATVSGALSTVSNGVTLTVSGAAANLTLAGSSTGKTGRFAGAISQTGLASVGSWLLTPEPVSHTYAFGATVSRGRHRGLVLGGYIAIAATSEPTGRFDATVSLDDGSGGSTTVPADGWLDAGNVHIVIHLPHQGNLVGVATPSMRRIRGSAPFLYLSGTFVGPSTDDTGSWFATQES